MSFKLPSLPVFGKTDNNQAVNQAQSANQPQNAAQSPVPTAANMNAANREAGVNMAQGNRRSFCNSSQ